MANQTIAHAEGSESLDALTQERMRMWNGFTSATMWALIFVILVLVGMAVFLL